MKKYFRLFIFAAMIAALSSCMGKQLLVMSFNVRYSAADDGENSWEYRRSATPAMLNRLTPDVFGVQEALPDQIEYILESCPAYKCYGIGRNDGVEGERMSIFYNSRKFAMEDCGTWWLSETPYVPSVGWDAKHPRTATWALMRNLRTGRRFYFVDTHLDHKGVLARKEGLQMVVKKIQEMDPGVPMVLVGDFNVEPSDDCLVELDKLMSSARSTALKTDATPSFNGFKPIPYKTIDYIYYSGFASAKEFRVITESFDGKPFISDHYPVIARLVY